MVANGSRSSTTTGADNVTPIFSESPRGQVFPARDDPATVVPPVSVATGRYWWRVHHCNGGMVHAHYRVVRVPRVNSLVPTWSRRMSSGVRTLPVYL